MTEKGIVDGVCCQYCRFFNSSDCPITAASPWSRWGNFCNLYEPDPEEPEAKTLVCTGEAVTTEEGQ